MRPITPLTITAMLLFSLPVLARPSGVEVTRFHNGAALAGQDVAVVAADPAVGASLAFAGVAGPVAAELARAGMPAAAAGATPALVATIRYDARAFEEPRKTQFSIGLGAGSFGRRGGVGVGGNMPVGSRTRSVTEVTLAVQIRRTADNSAVWEGRATDVLAASQAGNAPARLAAALFAGFPGTNGETLRVKNVPAPAPPTPVPPAPAPAPPAATGQPPQ